MGKGLALAFREAFPDVFREYERACHAREIVPGRVQVVETKAKRGPKYVINFPTKRHWRDRSDLDDIKAGVADLAVQMGKLEIVSIAIPALGCGLGGLLWNDVRKVIMITLSAKVAVKGSVRVVLFEPH
ncbi:MAG: Appr-p processing protein [Myxococcaceae bacterium]|nr:Appr-p processing protein [Myxococcaceae bacterium]